MSAGMSVIPASIIMYNYVCDARCDIFRVFNLFW